MPALLFRVDAGPHIGLGHLRRCLALAAALRARRAEPVIIASAEREVQDEPQRALDVVLQGLAEAASQPAQNGGGDNRRDGGDQHIENIAQVGNELTEEGERAKAGLEHVAEGGGAMRQQKERQYAGQNSQQQRRQAREAQGRAGRAGFGWLRATSYRR